MKAAEELKALRALKAIAAIPLPHNGFGRTASIEGLLSYEKDMREATKHINNITLAMSFREPIDENDVIALEEIAKRN